MTSFLGALLSWQVLAGIAVGIIIILILSRILVHKPKAVQTILDVLQYADSAILFFMPDKYKEVYQALVTAVKSIADGTFTGDEAITTAREIFAGTLKALGVTLNDQEKTFVDQVLVFVIGMIVKDKAASAVAINKVCSVKGYSL